MRLRLGLQEEGASEECGSCMQKCNTFDHGLRCQKIGKTPRHNKIQEVVVSVLHELRYSVTPYAKIQGDSEHTSDFSVVINRIKYYVDVSVIHPTTGPETTQLHWAKQREVEKEKHYQAAFWNVDAAGTRTSLKDEQKVLVPFIMESYGGFGPAALRFLRLAFKHCKTPPSEDILSFHIAITRLAMANQEGNADLYERTTTVPLFNSAISSQDSGVASSAV
jgi:hypothetical protein